MRCRELRAGTKCAGIHLLWLARAILWTIGVLEVLYERPKRVNRLTGKRTEGSRVPPLLLIVRSRTRSRRACSAVIAVWVTRYNACSLGSCTKSAARRECLLILLAAGNSYTSSYRCHGVAQAILLQRSVSAGHLPQTLSVRRPSVCVGLYFFLFPSSSP